MVIARKSSVTVAYPNGCVVEVKAGATYTIETPELCVTASTAVITPTGLLTAGAVAGGIAAAVVIAGKSGGASP